MLRSGYRLSSIRGGGGEFDSLREYHPDDEFRRINWRATARSTKTISNTYREERNQQVLLLVDASRPMAGAVAGGPPLQPPPHPRLPPPRPTSPLRPPCAP